MPEIEIRPAIGEDLPVLLTLDPHYMSEHVWQMEYEAEENQVNVSFREVRLPRSVRVEYPRPLAQLAANWEEFDSVLVAVHKGEVVGYASLNLGMAPGAAWMTNLVVARRLRRQGIGSSLVLASQEWGSQHNTHRLILEMQTKNYPTIHLAQKLGFDFCGYSDRYFVNQDIGLFFAKYL